MGMCRPTAGLYIPKLIGIQLVEALTHISFEISRHSFFFHSLLLFLEGSWKLECRLEIDDTCVLLPGERIFIYI